MNTNDGLTPGIIAMAERLSLLRHTNNELTTSISINEVDPNESPHDGTTGGPLYPGVETNKERNLSDNTTTKEEQEKPSWDGKCHSTPRDCMIALGLISCDDVKETT